MKKLLTLLTITTFAIHISAQNLQLRGRILSGKNSIEYANVLLQTKDSAFVTGGVTDQRGSFSFTNIASGNYRLKISSLGYKTKNIELASLSSNKDLDDIQLDSSSVVLDEVVVKGSCVVNQNDRKIYLPTAHQIKASTNGMDILMHMKLNRVQVDPMHKTITSSYPGEVQLRINGAKVSTNEVQALRPEDIQRIEYHEDPSLRYGDKVAVVIDYITKVRHSGGYLGIDTQNSPHVTFGNNGVNGKINYKNSEWGLDYWGMYRYLNGYWRDNYEVFNYDDGSKFVRKEIGEPGVLTENHHYITLSYSYRQGEKWSLIARLRENINASGMKTNSYLYPILQRNSGVNMLDDSKNRNSSPSFDLYFQRKYPKNQILMLNAVLTYINSNNTRFYKESQSGINLTDITSKINGDKYSFIAEGIYEKEFKIGKLSSGFNLYQEYSKDKYKGDVMAGTNLHATYLNFYTEWSQKIKKFNYRVSVGGVQVRYSQADNKMEKLLPTARVRMGYKFSDNWNISLNSNLSYSPPELGDISDVKQIIDSLQIRKGNPDLRECTYYTNNFMLDFNKNLLSVNLNLFYQYQKNPIMESILLNDNKFIHMMENQDSWQKVNPQIQVKVGPIKDIFNISLSTGMNYYDSKGLTYRHNYTNWYYRLEASAMYKKWMAYFQIQNRKRDFYGEYLNSDEAYHLLMLRYTHKNLTVGVMTLNPFVGKNSYKRPSETRNKYITSSSCWYLRESSRLYVATLTWNFSFGRKYQSVERHLNNEDTKTGSMKPGK